MKKKIMFQKFIGVMASFAWVAAIWAANTTCAFCTYQDEAPEGIFRLSKIR